MAYSAGTAFLTVVPSFRNIQHELGELGEQIGRSVDRAMTGQLPATMRRVTANADRDGRNFGRRFGEGAERELRTALNRIPEIRIPTNDAERRIRNVRRELSALRPARVGVDLDDQQFLRRLHAAERELDSIIDSDHTITVRADLEDARDRLRRFLSDDMIRQSRVSGRNAGGAFGEEFSSRLRRAAQNVDIEPHLNMTGAEFKLFRFAQQLRSLSNQTIGVDLDAGAAMAELQALHAQLATIALNDPNITVRVNAGRAAAELFAIMELAHRVDNIDPDINVDTDGGSAAMRQLGSSMDIPIHRLGVLVALALSIGPIIVPAAAAAAVAIGGIATAALAAVAGVGVLALGLFGVFAAVKALDKYQTDAAKSAKSLSQSENQVASAADSVRSAERSLANTRASVASANQRAAKAVADAEGQVADAVRDRQRAEEDLIKAIKAAQQADEDRRLSIRGNALDIRQANLDIAEAKKELDAVLANPRASEAEREQARISYEQRVLQLDSLSVQQKRLAEEQAQFNKEGVNGTDQVKSAQERLRTATERVADSQERVAEAIEAQQETQRQGQFQLEQATQSLTSAQRSLQQATVNAGVAGGAALDNLRVAMNALSPAGQRFVRFIVGLKDEFKSLRDAAQETLLPGLQRGIEGLLHYLPAVTAFVSRMGRAVGDSFAWAVQQMQHPAWQRFFTFLSQSAVPAWDTLVRAGEAFSRGLASLIVALGAFNPQLGRGLVAWAEGFARWAEQLDQSRGFQKFIAYVREAGPDVLHFLGQLFELAKRLIIAWAPVGDLMLKVLTGITEGLNAIPLPVLTAFLFLIAGISSAMLLFKGVGVIWRAVGQTIGTSGRIISNTLGGLRFLFNQVGQGATFAQRMQYAWNGALIRGAQAIGPVYRGVASLYGVLRSTAVAGAARAQGLWNTALSRGAAALTPLVLGAQRLGATLRGATFASTAAAAQRVWNTAVTDGRIIASLATAQVQRLVTAIQTHPRVVAAAASAQRILNTAWTDARIVASIATTQMGRVVGAIRSFPAVAAATAFAQRTLNTAWTDARIIGSLVTTQVGRYITAARSFPAVASASAFAQRTLNTAWTDARIIGSLAATQIGRLASAVSLGGAASAVASRTAGFFSTTMSGVRTVAGVAATAAGRFASSLGAIGSAATTGAMRGLGSLVSFLGGPWGVALTVATIGLTYFTLQAAEQRAKNEELRDSLNSLVDAYRATDGSARQSVEGMVRTNKALRDLVLNSERYGISLDDVVSSIEGNGAARERVLGGYDKELDRLKKLRDEAKFGADEQEAYRKAGVKDAVELDKKIAGLENERKAIATSTDERKKANEAAELVRTSSVGQAEAQAALTSRLMEGVEAAKAIRGAMDDASVGTADYGEVLDALASTAADAAGKADLLALVAARVGQSMDSNADKAALFGRVLDQLGDATQLNGPVFDSLVSVFGTIASSSLNAKDKVDLLKRAMDQIYGAAISQYEADLQLVRSQQQLTTQVSANSAGFDLNAAKAGKNTEAVLANIEALKSALLAARDKYVQDIANGVAEADARAAHEKTTKAILDAIPPTQRNTKAVEDLNARYGAIPPAVTTKVTTPGLDAAISEMIDAHAIQIGLAAQPPWSKETIASEARNLRNIINGLPNSTAAFKAAGGEIEGWSPTPTADNIPIWATAGEFMHQRSAVDYYGVGAMDAINQRRIPRQLLRGYASGGFIGQRHFRDSLGEWPVNMPPTIKLPDLASLWKQWEQAQAAWTAAQSAGGSDFGPGPGFLPWPSSPAASRGDSGVWRSIVALILSTGPLSGTFGNAYRPGDPLWHGSGRAVDWMGFNQNALASFLAARRPLELIHRTPVRDYAYTRGVNKGSFNNTLMEQHRNHVHIAMDDGGWLQTGWNPPIWNGTGAPEAVLTPHESNALVAMAHHAKDGRLGNIYNFAFRDTTLTPSKLRALQDADAAYARVGRAR